MNCPNCGEFMKGHGMAHGHGVNPDGSCTGIIDEYEYDYCTECGYEERC